MTHDADKGGAPSRRVTPFPIPPPRYIRQCNVCNSAAHNDNCVCFGDQDADRASLRARILYYVYECERLEDALRVASRRFRILSYVVVFVMIVNLYAIWRMWP